MEAPKMVVFVVKRYAVRETDKWRYAVHKAIIGRYVVRKGGGGVTHYYYISITFTTHKMYWEQIKMKCIFIPTGVNNLLLKHCMKQVE